MMRCPSDGIFPLQLMRCLQRCSQLLVFQLIMSSALTAHQNTPKALAANRGSAKGPAAPQMAVNVPFALPKFFAGQVKPGDLLPSQPISSEALDDLLPNWTLSALLNGTSEELPEWSLSRLPQVVLEEPPHLTSRTNVHPIADTHSDACTRARQQKQSKRDTSVGQQPHSAISLMVTDQEFDEEDGCVNVAGSYTLKKGKDSRPIEVVQDGCNVSAIIDTVPHAGKIQGHTLSLPTLKSEGLVRQDGDIVWSPERRWLRRPAPGELSCDELGADGENLTLSPHEFRYAQCPRGKYLSLRSIQDHRERSKRLRKALCASKAHGMTSMNSRAEDHSKRRGYMTYESALWPKREECLKLPVEHKGGNFSSNFANSKHYRDDTTMKMTRLVRIEEKIEFRKVWKAASTTLPRYLTCEWGEVWKHADSKEPANEDFRTVAAVREPIDRWISGVGEILARLINRWCINGPCEDLDEAKEERLRLGTTWHHIVEASGNAYDPAKLNKIISRIVHDTSCNYRFFASDHLNTQSTFLSQNSGTGAFFNLIIKLEELAPGLGELNKLAPAPEPQGACEVEPANIAECKPNNHGLPSSIEIKRVLNTHPFLLRELCLIYAQDFICFDYELPRACRNLF